MGNSKGLIKADGGLRGGGGTSSSDRLLDENEAATLLGLSVRTLRRWRWARKGPTYFKIGGAVRYAPADLESFKAAGRREAA